MKARLTALLLFTLTAVPALQAGEWVPLFDGKSLAGWTNFKGEKVTTDGWQIEGDALHLKGKGGNIISEKEYSEFELEWEWKIAEGGNNGLKYWVNPISNQQLGVEYQMIDDLKHPDAKKKGNHDTASFYDIQAVSQDKQLKAAGQWNTSKVVSKGGKLEHWLNGKLVGTADTASDSWKQGVAASKFGKYPGFAPGKGRIMLTDHGDETWFRNIRIKE